MNREIECKYVAKYTWDRKNLFFVYQTKWRRFYTLRLFLCLGATGEWKALKISNKACQHHQAVSVIFVSGRLCAPKYSPTVHKLPTPLESIAVRATTISPLSHANLVEDSLRKISFDNIWLIFMCKCRERLWKYIYWKIIFVFLSRLLYQYLERKIQ